MSQDRLLERFLQYVAVDTTSNEKTEEYPSCQGQFTLGKVLVDQLQEVGIDTRQDERGIVLGTIPGNSGKSVETICFNAHLDTSPETTGANVKPQVLRYGGGDIALPGDDSQVIRVDENPELPTLVGKTLITTDGTTLLGADDKAGIAAIVEAALRMQETNIEHGPIQLLFTCDEEIGRGVDHVDVSGLGATACYTLDGPGSGQIDVETFSADAATISFRGVNIHPSIAKGRMVNALRVAGDYLRRLPRDLAPETTEDRLGFLHPYVVEGGVDSVTVQCLLRHFDTAELATQADILRRVAEETKQDWPGSEIDIMVRQQYRNLGDGLQLEPRAVDYAKKAFNRLGIEPRLSIIRGGTDGSRLTELGLPTPNLSTGQHNPHSRLEWACLEEMEFACQSIVEICKVWADETKAGS